MKAVRDQAYIPKFTEGDTIPSKMFHTSSVPSTLQNFLWDKVVIEDFLYPEKWRLIERRDL